MVVQRTAAVYRSAAAALTLGSIMALLLVGSVERSSTSASAAGIELVGTSAAGIELTSAAGIKHLQMLEDSAPAVDYKWKGQKPEVNVFDDYDQDFQEGKWKDYKEPSNVFDDLPELENADHKWEVRVTNLSINMQIFAHINRPEHLSTCRLTCSMTKMSSTRFLMIDTPSTQLPTDTNGRSGTLQKGSRK